ncbi:chloride channel protein [Palaeococcus ferrophilus]|uniref:chloride channel protein n=1 Tax=Palaeococcus ferrophilus TaxID=83868 RepID=UPI00064F21B9|nr:chloride channel protein [Palaeococcus ferrophilus]
MPNLRRWGMVLTFSVLSGIVGGLGAVFFRVLIRWTHTFFFGFILPNLTIHYHGYNLGYILLPALGSILIAPIIKFCPSLKGNGIPEVIEAVVFRRGHIEGRFSILKIVATAVTIGSGGSVGREGPIGFIGAALSSLMGHYFKLKPEMRKLITTCGLAAGIAGTFNTPLAGAMFALEVVYMGAFSLNLVPIFLAAVTGNAITLAFLGQAFEVSIPSALGHTLPELLFFSLMGFVLGLLAAAYVKALYALMEKFESLNAPTPLKLVFGGLSVGLIGMFFPSYGIFGIGYGGMEMAMAGKIGVALLLTLALAKMTATLLTISSGHSGGIFAPSLYIGAMLGAAFGESVFILFPGLGVNPSSYALAGMAAFFSGMTQAPLTQILMVTELTRSYSLLPAVMTSATLGFLTARFLLGGDSVYTLKLKRKGLHVKTGRPLVLEMISVGEIMTTEPVFVHEWDTLFDVEHLVAETGHDCFPVLNENGEVVGIVGVKDFLRKPPTIKKLPVRRFLRKEYAVTYPSETAEDAFEKLMAHDQNLLPVVDEEGKLLGVITKRDIYKAYYRGLEGMYIE